MRPDGVILRVPRRRTDDQRIRRLIDGIHDVRAVYRDRASDLRAEADNLDPATPRAAAARGKAVAYREAADLLDALLREPR